MTQTHRFFGRRTGPADWHCTSDFGDTVPVVHPADTMDTVIRPHSECVAAQLENQKFDDDRNDTGERADWFLIGAFCASALSLACVYLGTYLAG